MKTKGLDKTICELFAGVGGFRLGFERADPDWKTVWFSQWEPGASKQWAHDCYVQHFGDCTDMNGEYHTGEDIAAIDKNVIPGFSVLVGGFPCQDYSVAHSLNSSKGIEGKKGVLWWQIYEILKIKHPPFCVFENVDRLLKSPAKQRGRDFGIILSCLAELGYSVEWRVVNAADYGGAQRRRRVFIFAFADNAQFAAHLRPMSPADIFSGEGLMAKAFPVLAVGEIKTSEINYNDLEQVSNTYKFDFMNSGYMTGGKIWTCDVTPVEVQSVTLGDILEPEADEKYNIKDDKLSKWEYLKGGKKIPRKTKEGYEYIYSEGPVAFPDCLDKPGKTMLTSEGTLNRSTHIVIDKTTGKLRILTPKEAERMQGFDDNWTATGMPERMRYFCMGNALVVPMITRMAKILSDIVESG